MKSLAIKKPPKEQREKQVLLALVEAYLETGKPVSSNSLKEQGLKALSSATIRNYFAKLEEEGYLKQQHSSGGRIPTQLAFQFYANFYHSSGILEEKERKALRAQLSKETREIAGYLHHTADVISEATQCAVFLSAPRFDQDFVMDVKLVGIDQSRCLCVLITDFGVVQTEQLYAEKKLSNFSLKRIESYFRWKMTGLDKPVLSPEEEVIAHRFYSEVMLRHIVGHNQFSAEDIYKTGFSKLLNYSDFNDASALAAGLALFENPNSLNTLLKECVSEGQLKCWIGDQLQACSAIAVPYRINQSIVGSIAILGPNRIPYRKLFGILQEASLCVTEMLTNSLYKFKITYRQPTEQPGTAQIARPLCLLLENKYDQRKN